MSAVLIAFLVIFYHAILAGIAIGLVLGGLLVTDVGKVNSPVRVAPSPTVMSSAARAALAMTPSTESEAEPASGTPFTRSPEPIAARANTVSRSIASWYGSSYRGDPSGDQFLGNTTACGEVLTERSFLVAHRTLPCGTLIEVMHGERSVVVRVGDRGPFVVGREFDLTRPVRDALGCGDLCEIEWRVVE